MEDAVAGSVAPGRPIADYAFLPLRLVEAYALMGRRERAVELFERVTAYANDLGLLAEEADPASGELRGNFSQAFSHVGLVNAAWAIHQGTDQPVGAAAGTR